MMPIRLEGKRRKRTGAVPGVEPTATPLLRSRAIRPGGLQPFYRAAIVGCWLILTAIGCGSEPTFKFDELDLVAAEEELEEFPLGEYTIPVPAAEKGVKDGRSKHNRIQIDFELFALVSPHKKSRLTYAWQRHQGMIRDRVIRVCRNSTLEVLHEPELGTLKAKLMDALAAHLGEDIHQLLITEVVTQEI